MSYIVNNKEKTVIFFGGLLLLLLIGGYVYQKQVAFNGLEPQVYPLVLQVGDTLHFKENTAKQGSITWTFGDGEFSLAQQGKHVYKKAGFYEVTYRLKDQYTQVFSIQVKQDSQQNHGDYFTKIEGPTAAMQYENIVFRAVTDKATLFSWKFGETGNVDAKEPFVLYAYQEPGEYEILLYTDETAYAVTHRITIYPSFKDLSEDLNVEEKYQAIDADFKEHLQAIAQGGNFNLHYNYLINKYLCQNENAVVQVNGNKSNSFYYYCMGLKFDKQARIQTVKVSFDAEETCVTKVSIVQLME